MRCADCKVTFENEAFKYCPLCGKKMDGTAITFPHIMPDPFLPAEPYPSIGDPIMPYPATSPSTPYWKSGFIHRIPLWGEQTFYTTCGQT